MKLKLNWKLIKIAIFFIVKCITFDWNKKLQWFVNVWICLQYFVYIFVGLFLLPNDHLISACCQFHILKCLCNHVVVLWLRQTKRFWDNLWKDHYYALTLLLTWDTFMDIICNILLLPYISFFCYELFKSRHEGRYFTFVVIRIWNENH